MQVRAKVVYDWQATDANEMSIVTGQLLTILSVNDRGWALAENKFRQSGWVPNDFLQVLGDDEVFEEVTPPSPAPIVDEEQAEDVQSPEQELTNAVQTIQHELQHSTSSLQPESLDDANAVFHTCFGCREPVSGMALIAKGHHFHNDCFVCVTCKSPLNNTGFLERDEQFYCERDYYLTQGHICSHCNEVIIGSHIVGNGKPYHVDHLLCGLCGVSIGTDILHVKDDMNVCHACYNKSFAAVCYRCDKPIEYQIFTALDRTYHKECFVCAEGDHPMPDESFHVQDDKIYCPEHYRKLFSKQCSGCQKEITGQYLQVLDYYYHSDCWKCNSCDAQLSSTGCARKNNKFYCPTCVVKVPDEAHANSIPSPRANPPTPAAPKQDAPAPAAVAPSAAKPPVAQPKPVPSPSTTAPTPAPAAQAPAPAPTANANLGESMKQTLHAPTDDGSDISTEEMRRRLLEVSKQALAASEAAEPAPALLPEREYYTLAELMINSHLPPCVDRAKKEQYLADDDFQSIFKMSKADFAQLKFWKQKELKQGAKIF